MFTDISSVDVNWSLYRYREKKGQQKATLAELENMAQNFTRFVKKKKLENISKKDRSREMPLNG